MAKKIKIYTKTGDSGTTSLFGGERVKKNSARIDAYGTVDELNSVIGIIISFKPDREITEKLLRVQAELFVLGAGLATPDSIKVKIPKISKSNITKLEKEIDSWNLKLPQLRNFIQPGGGAVGAHLHLARTVARRAERAVVFLAISEKIYKNDIVYINRLSDWFFMLARYVNMSDGDREVVWKGRG